MASRFFDAVKAYVNRPGNEFFLVILLVPLPMILFSEPSRWIAFASLAYTALIARLYGGSRWLDGYVAGKGAEQERLREASGGQPQEAQHLVEAFNRSYRVGTKVTYLKSEIEGRQITTVDKPAYIQGDDTPMVVLGGIGTALIGKVEPYFGS